MSGLSDRLNGIMQRLESKTLVVGFMARATYDDGTSVAMIAAQNEFGGTINIPEHTVTLYRKININERMRDSKTGYDSYDYGSFAKNGRFVKKYESNFSTQHTVPAYTVNIPSRPFFRQMVASESPTWAAKLGNCLIASHYDADKALDMMGEDMRTALQESIKDFTTPELAPSTVAKKGFSKPLIDTSHMINSVAFELRDHD